MSHPNTDIILTVHDALDYVRACVELLYQHTKNFRLIIVDDVSGVETREWAYGPECLGRNPSNLYIRTNKQRWFTRASNLGLRMVRTPWAIVLNSDTQLNDGWLDELYACKALAEEQGLKVGVVGHVGFDAGKRWEATSHPNYVTAHCWLVNMEAMVAMAHARGHDGWYLNEVDQQQIHINSDRIGCHDLNRLGYSTIASYQASIGHHGGKSWGYNLGRVMNLNLDEVNDQW